MVQTFQGLPTSIIAALLGMVGAIIGALLAGLFRYKTISEQIEGADERAVARAYLEHRVEALNLLQEELHNCKRAYLGEMEDATPTTFTKDKYEALGEIFEDFESAFDRVKIVFENDDLEAITEFYKEMKKVNEQLESIRDQPDDRDEANSPGSDTNLDTEKFEEKYEDAREGVTSRLGQPLKKFHS